MATETKKTTKKVTAKETKEVKAVKAVKEVKTPATAEKTADAKKISVLIRPHITEKAGLHSESHNIYTFQVEKTATKHTVLNAIKTQYKVNPTKIRIINLPAKEIFIRGKFGTKSGVKKALIFLKKGDKIDIA